MLSASHLRVTYGEHVAVDDVSFTVEQGQVLAVLGPSGCGKSTLLRALAGLEPLAAGRITTDGADLAGVPTHRRGFSLMFQDGQLFGHLTVARNVGYALRLRRVPPAESQRRVAELLALVGLTGYGDRLPASLSGGERQRVALARALAVRPRLLLLDEPLSSLDASLRQRLAAELREILTVAGTTALLVTHDHEEAFAVADRLAVMRAGRLVQEGAIADVWAHPADPETALFLGYARVLEGEPAARVAAAAGLPTYAFLALRRSALTVALSGPLAGVVLGIRSEPEQLRLVLDVDGVGTVDGVAPLGSHLGVGEHTALVVDPTRLAGIPLPASSP